MRGVPTPLSSCCSMAPRSTRTPWSARPRCTPSRWAAPHVAAATRTPIGETAGILIAHGADVNRRATGDRGQTPLDDALANNNDHVAAVLRKHGAQVSGTA